MYSLQHEGQNAMAHTRSFADGVQDKIPQIRVLHEDNYERTYDVSKSQFELVEDPDKARTSKGAQCYIMEKDAISQEEIEKVPPASFLFLVEGTVHGKRNNAITSEYVQRMKARPFAGGSAEDRRKIAEKDGDLEAFTHHRMQWWDTTQAQWYAGVILGMWEQKPRHWIFLCDEDETEYDVDVDNDVWKLVCLLSELKHVRSRQHSSNAAS
jgi:hypothetical protein